MTVTANVMRATVVLAVAAALCGCDSGQVPQHPNPDVCDAPASPAVAKAEAQSQPGDTAKEKFGHAREDADNCVHRLAYSLAHSPDRAETVADAVVAGCDGPISFATGWAVAGQLLTTQDPEKELKGQMRDEALFRVVQARAGNCATPSGK